MIYFISVVLGYVNIVLKIYIALTLFKKYHDFNARNNLEIIVPRHGFESRFTCSASHSTSVDSTIRFKLGHSTENVCMFKRIVNFISMLICGMSI